MSEKRNRFKKQEQTPEPDPSKRISFGAIKNVTGFVQDERFQRLFGLFLIFSSLYLLLSFISYPFSWKHDQQLWEESLFDAEANAQNWLGRSGAFLSHHFIFNGFGYASFLLLPVFFLFGVKLFLRAEPIKLWKLSLICFSTAIWVSAAIGFIFFDSENIQSGGIGHQINVFLNALAGKVGAGAILFFTAFSCIISALNIRFDLSKKQETGEMAEVPEATGIPLNVNRMKDGAPARSAAADDAVEGDEDDEPEMFVRKAPEPVKQGDVAFEVENFLENDQEEPEESSAMAATAPAPPEVLEDLSFEVQKAEDKAVEMTQEEIEEIISGNEDYDPKLDLSYYKYPHIDLLQKHVTSNAQVTKEELEANKEKILGTLKNYGIEIERIKATIGPTVTLYEIIPVAGVRIAKIKNLEDDIALSLAALGIRIIAPIPGKGTIGIEVPNQSAEIVAMRSLIASDKFQNNEMELPIALGKTISNETFITDLAKMPHLLMAGATGQGKSVGLNAILVSLLYKKHPSQVKLILIDPKKVELTLFNKIERHFLAKLPDSEEAIITDTKKVINTLNSLCVEMDTRYELLKNAQVRNIKEYNAKFLGRRLNPKDGHRYLPYIVLVIDEFADLIMTAGKEVETPIARLAQLARAIGIHLIIATQRPSVNIITGTIKANFPARIAFRVTSKIDSRTILDAGGAEQLIGRGDMLLSTGNDLIRIQCAFVDTPEVEDITDYIGSQQGYPHAFLLPEFRGDDDESGGKKEFDSSDRDSLFEDAARIVVQNQQGSASLLQRRLKLGYNRAGRLVDQLEAAGIIGPFEGSKARQVLISDEASLEHFLTTLK